MKFGYHCQALQAASRILFQICTGPVLTFGVENVIIMVSLLFLFLAQLMKDKECQTVIVILLDVPKVPTFFVF